MDRALRRGLSESLDAGKNCPDPSILAAYFDRELAAAETERWEVHFSGCARCQEQLAVLARTESAVAAKQLTQVPIGWRRVWTLRWLAPLATAAAAVMLWVAIRPAPPTLPAPDTTVASRQVAPAAEPPAAAKPATEADKVARVAEAERANLADKRSIPKKPAAASTTPQQVARAPQAAVASAEKKEAETLAAQAPVRPESRSIGTAASAQAVAATRDQAQPVIVAEAARDEAKVQPRAEAPAAPTEGMRSKMAAAELQKAAPPAGRSPSAGEGPGREGLMALRGPQVVVAVPEGNVLWRFGAKGLIEKSTDGGKTWSRVQSPVTVDLVAGSAPSEKVCWAVGVSGVVLRSTDGEHWEKLASPTTDNLHSITARDSLHATVVTTGGKTFVTADGGQTWRET